MGFILESSAIEILCVVVVVLWSLYAYVTEHYTYWREKGVPCADAVFPLGTLTNVLLGQTHIGDAYKHCYEKFKGERFFGIIDGRIPTLVIRDPELIKLILTKDFHCFTDRIKIPKVLKNEYIIHHLFNLSGQEWKKIRLILSPTFTSGKMKTMFPLIEKCSDQLKEHMEMLTETDPVAEVKDILARFTMDIIATCAFGLEINSLSDKDCEFYRVGIQIFKTTKFRMARRIWYGVIPVLAKIYAPAIVPPHIAEFFSKIVRETVSFRVENRIVRNDFLDLLIKIKQNKDVLVDGDKNNGQSESENKNSSPMSGLTIEEITAQSFIFFAAGFETASSTAAFCLFELACNPDVQEKLYQEISNVLEKNGGKPTYQALQEMMYMDQVIKETLRRYSSLAILNRICTEAYQVPDSGLVIEKGMKITIPIYAIHHDPEYYPEPYRFNPDRFTQERVRERHPYLHLPFGEGPRMCIGMRFGLMQTKIALTTMVYNYKFDLTPNTEVPISIYKEGVTTLPENPVLLKINKRSISN